MPVINIEDLTEKDKLKMEVDQLKKEVTLERMMVTVVLFCILFVREISIGKGFSFSMGLPRWYQW